MHTTAGPQPRVSALLVQWLAIPALLIFLAFSFAWLATAGNPPPQKAIMVVFTAAERADADRMIDLMERAQPLIAQARAGQVSPALAAVLAEPTSWQPAQPRMVLLRRDYDRMLEMVRQGVAGDAAQLDADESAWGELVQPLRQISIGRIEYR